ncbi:hypothetical protein KDK88_04195 [bacterium]|nr:hypothetical protein [bacterium]HPF34763.1 FlgD immunoglobulin-like domain containing protein [Candidatus Krumholzibacteria bacterium]HRX51821.1 FlgD immunoglobulin-like domain containing protein [Candidatus Krumholzibacteria bacterium]
MLKFNNIFALSLLAFLLTAGAAAAAAVNGVVGLPDGADRPAYAVWIPLGEGRAIDGFEWYNNDGGAPFARISAVAGDITNPQDVADATLLVEQVYGATCAWSSCTFNQPVGSETPGLYLMFEVAAGDGYVHEGQSGGVGLGHETGDGVVTSWFSGDGATWHALVGTMKFAVRPVPAAGKSGEVLVLSRVPERDETAGNVAPRPALAVQVYPNPFNPRVSLAFTLDRDCRVTASAFDLRGRLVRRIAARELSVGDHIVEWDGRDDAGEPVPSGTYYLRVDDGRRAATARATMLK